VVEGDRRGRGSERQSKEASTCDTARPQRIFTKSWSYARGSDDPHSLAQLKAAFSIQAAGGRRGLMHDEQSNKCFGHCRLGTDDV
jgi:hypothetical protein